MVTVPTDLFFVWTEVFFIFLTFIANNLPYQFGNEKFQVIKIINLNFFGWNKLFQNNRNSLLFLFHVITELVICRLYSVCACCGIIPAKLISCWKFRKSWTPCFFLWLEQVPRQHHALKFWHPPALMNNKYVWIHVDIYLFTQRKFIFNMNLITPFYGIACPGRKV